MTLGGEEWGAVMEMCEAAENDPRLRPALRARWPKVEEFTIPNDDPRIDLRGQRGLRATEIIEKHAIILPYQVHCVCGRMFGKVVCIVCQQQP